MPPKNSRKFKLKLYNFTVDIEVQIFVMKLRLKQIFQELFGKIYLK